jgi:2-oxo-4-hydroxy-4-carboxy--5-ureidoimidazoline (OHCU) decarboxylase
LRLRCNLACIIAVKGLDKARILETFEQRTSHEPDIEFAEACR